MDTWTVVRLLHLLAVAFFVGGQLVLVAAVVPGLRHQDDPSLMRSIARRFGIGSVVALAILLATGVAMAEHFDRWSDGALQAKLALVALIGVLTATHTMTPHTRVISAAVLVASLAVVWLGVALGH